MSFYYITKWDWVLIALAIVGLIIFASYVKPAKIIEKEIIAPAAEVVGISRTCPGGWANTSGRDEHLQRLSCEKAGWQVVLDGEGKFQHAVQLDTPGAQFIYDKTKVPGWPADR